MELDIYLFEQKKELEAVVIGEVILENKYIHIGGILGPQNFGNYVNTNNRIIWQTIERMYPLIPVDLITVDSKLYEWYRVDYKHLLIEYTSKIASTMHIRYHAILLLELDIRMKIISILKNQYLKEKSKGEYNTAADIKEMTDHVRSPKTDLFETIDGIMSFISAENYEELHQQLESIINYLPEKVNKLRQESQVETCISHLSKLTNMLPQNELIVEKMVNTIKVIYQQPTLDRERVKLNVTELLKLI